MHVWRADQGSNELITQVVKLWNLVYLPHIFAQFRDLPHNNHTIRLNSPHIYNTTQKNSAAHDRTIRHFRQVRYRIICDFLPHLNVASAQGWKPEVNKKERILETLRRYEEH